MTHRSHSECPPKSGGFWQSQPNKVYVLQEEKLLSERRARKIPDSEPKTPKVWAVDNECKLHATSSPASTPNTVHYGVLYYVTFISGIYVYKLAPSTLQLFCSVVGAVHLHRHTDVGTPAYNYHQKAIPFPATFKTASCCRAHVGL